MLVEQKLITSNYELGEASIVEFTRVLIPEAYKKPIKVFYRKELGFLVLDIEIEERKKTFRYQDFEDKIDDQKIISLKISLLKMFEKNYPWGGLIGVRPTKVIRRLLNLGYSYDEANNILEEIYLVKPEKIKLLTTIFKKETELMNDKAYSLYIGIPFCPTKCRYCSFASFEIGGPVGVRYYEGFVETLLEEIELAGILIKENNFILESIYIGGGTPSTLNEIDLEKVLKAINKNINMDKLKEFTFEAGREDSITDRKLELAKEYGVGRISLNPQTFNLNTLKNMNRNFQIENFNRCYYKIKELGFIINMDLILGLPLETEKDIVETLEEIKKYDIENLTVHTLALKKASVLYKDEDISVSDLDRKKVEDKLKEVLIEKNMEPYYLYRQKNSADWGENVGYSKKGFESIFNIEMIEENQSTIGIGGGAITKKISWLTEDRQTIERIVNPKEPATYIREMKERFAEKIKLFQK